MSKAVKTIKDESMAAERLAAIRDQQKSIDLAAQEEEAAKQQYHERRAYREELQAAMGTLIRGGGAPLFEQDEPTDGEAAGAAADGGDPEGAGWRDAALAELDEPSIPWRTLKALAEHEPAIETVGDLTDWQQTKGDFWAADVKGIGEAAQGKIADALDAFWGRRKQRLETAEPAEDADPDEVHGADEPGEAEA